MPYMIVKKGDEWCVFKHDEDNKPVGSTHGCHPSMEKAKKQMAALYVAENKAIDVEEIDWFYDEDAKAMRKKEGANSYPASAYLVVEDSDKPSTWHMRVKDENGKLDPRHMGAAHAALTVGYRGNVYQGPDKAKALAKLKRLYKEAGLDWPEEGKSLKMYDEYEYFVPWGVTTLADAMAAQEAHKEAMEIGHAVSMFQRVVDNIVSSTEVSNKSAAIKKVAGELAAMIDDVGEGNHEKSLDTQNQAEKLNKSGQEDYFTIKSIGDDRVGSYAVLWGDEGRKDLTGEFFDDKTEELTAIYDTVGRLPYIYHHGMDKTLKTAVIGVVDTLKKDSVGLWYEAQLKLADDYGEYVKKLLAEKKLKTSSQTFQITRQVDSKTGRIERWPIVEITATPTPAEYRMQPIEFLKSAYQTVGCEDIGCLVNTKYGVTPEQDDQGAEKARLLLELEQARLALLDL